MSLHAMAVLTVSPGIAAVLALMGALAMSTASAQSWDRNLSPAYAACTTKANSQSAATLDCLEKEGRRQDVRLNEAYKALMADLDAGGKKALLEAQRSWLKFRADNTRYVSSTMSGSFGASMASQTFVTMTADRAAELEEFARP